MCRNPLPWHDGIEQSADYSGDNMHAARDTTAVRHTVETLIEEIGRIVFERQELRAYAAGWAELEENRRRLGAAQSRLSYLLIERHLPQPGAA